MMKQRIPVLTVSGFSLMGLISTSCSTSGLADRPNIILILADDMGYSDLSCFGSEIQTPNLDRLAEQGVRMTQFYNASRSCPTRATLRIRGTLITSVLHLRKPSNTMVTIPICRVNGMLVQILKCIL
jgi:hypothetical protein